MFSYVLIKAHQFTVCTLRYVIRLLSSIHIPYCFSSVLFVIPFLSTKWKIKPHNLPHDVIQNLNNNLMIVCLLFTIWCYFTSPSWLHTFQYSFLIDTSFCLCSCLLSCSPIFHLFLLLLPCALNNMCPIIHHGILYRKHVALSVMK